MANWRKKIDPSIKDHLEIQIKESAKHRNVIELSENPTNAQLWVAIANLSKQLFDINLKITYLERALRESLSTPQKTKKPIKKKRSKK